ncbi:MAG: hypothetical protein IT185_02990 [Acidobacteria bacterium]|nr:hypothetical protein [Acidobacteriota bacterium]
MNVTIRRATGVCVVVCAALAWGTSLHAAFPRLVMVSGGTMPAPVVMTDWAVTAQLLQHLEPQQTPSAARLEGRPFFQVSMFWGPQWKQFMDEGRAVTSLRPEQANEFGRLYPAVGDQPAVLILSGAPRTFEGVVTPPTSVGDYRHAYALSAVSSRILARSGIPIGPV